MRVKVGCGYVCVMVLRGFEKMVEWVSVMFEGVVEYGKYIVGVGGMWVCVDDLERGGVVGE